MLKKIVCCYLLMFFCNYFFGCYTSENITKDKIMETQRIIEVVFQNGASIKFDRFGGKLEFDPEKVVGKDENGNDCILHLNGVKELRTKLNTVDLNNLDGKKLAEITTDKNYQIVFDNEGGYYNKDSNMICGIDTEVRQRNINLEFVKAAFLNKPDTISINNLRSDKNIRIKQAISNNGIARTFDESGGVYQNGGYYVLGNTTDGNIAKINLDDILYARIEKFDAVNTTIAVIVGVGIITLVAVAISSKPEPQPKQESCPFVYSYDGEKYIFDAEPFGGAITKGLERLDYSRLEYLKEVDGKYKLKVSNEIDETQFVNGMSLLVVDHPSNTDAIVNNDDKIFITKNLQNIISATDENGKDISKFIENEDNIMWLTKMPVHFNNMNGKTRNQLTFAFKKPSGVDSVNLIINAGTSFWGSNMIREMLALYGNELDKWYRKIDEHGNDYMMIMSFLQREELYALKLYLKEKNGWVEKSLIGGGGPFISERRILPLDIRNVEGDMLFFRVNPPVGFWTFDYLALDYNENFNSKTTEVQASIAEDYLGNNIIADINQNDDKYYSMPKTGDYFNIEFDAPIKQQGMERTVFLKSTGYYKIHLPESDAPNFQELDKFAVQAGSIVEYSIEKYIEWNNKYISEF